MPDSTYKKIPQTSSMDKVKQSVSKYDEGKKIKKQKKKNKKVSDYSYNKPITGKIILIVLLVLFILLFIVLGAVIFFKPQLQEFFSSL